MSTASPYQLAHIRWLQAPYKGASFFLVQSGGSIGYLVERSAGAEPEFFDAVDPEALYKACESATRAQAGNATPAAPAAGVA